MRSTLLGVVLPLALASLLAVTVPQSVAQPLQRSAGDLPQPDLVVPVGKTPAAALAAVLDRHFYDYDVFELDTEDLERRVRETGRLRMLLGNQVFDLTLELNDLRSPGHRVVLMTDHGPVDMDPGPVRTFAGRLAGDSESVVRLTVEPDGFSGYVRTEHDWLFIDPVSQYQDLAPGRDVVVYRDRDVRPEVKGSCGAAPVEGAARNLVSQLRVEAAAATLSKLEVATDGDGEFTQHHGASGASSRVETILNTVDGIFQLDFDLDIKITFKLLWSNPNNDPYTSADAFTFRQQYADYWNANFFWVNRDANQLFTRKDLTAACCGSGVIGVAFTGPQVCANPNLAYSIVEDRNSNFELTWISAHEMGHILNARHDNQAPINCPGVNCGGGTGPILCSNLQRNGPNRFSDCSIDDVTDHVANNGGCLN